VSSELVLAYQALAARAITVGATTYSAKSLTEVPDSLPDAELPVRLLQPVGARGGETEWITIGQHDGSMRMIVDIADELLLSEVGLGAQSSDVAEAQLDYTDAYIRAMKADRKLTTFSWIERVRPDGFLVRFPKAEGAPIYHGVRMITRIVYLLGPD
jgi:hypothetical protein